MVRSISMASLLVCALIWATGCNSFREIEESGSLECEIYCNMMEENCDLVFQGNRDRCLDDCEQFDFVPQDDANGNPIPLGDRVDNDDSYECRIYHLDTALNSSENNGHCEEAAPSGGGTCVLPGTDSDCAQLCHGATYGCNLTLEDYQNCEFDCQEASIVVRDSPEYRCRENIAKRARDTKNEGSSDPDRAVCTVVRDVFVDQDGCIEAAADAIPGFDPTM